MSEDLHIPRKFDMRSPESLIRKIVEVELDKSGGTVDGAVLADTLIKSFKNFGDADRQNWLEIERWATRFTPTSATLYDAVIDPAATTNGALHIYANITDFSVGEVTKLATSHLTVVAVVGRPGTNVVETSSITLGGPVLFVGGGASSTSAFFTAGGRPVIDFAGFAISSTNGWVGFVGCELYNSTSTNIGTLVTGQLYMNNSVLNAINAGGTRVITTPASTTLYAVDSAFYGNNGLSANVFCFDCHYQNGTVVTIGTGAGGTFLWDGGSFDPLADLTITLSSGNVYMRVSQNANAVNGVSSHVPDITVSTTGRTYIDWHTMNNYPSLTIAAGAGDCEIRGTFKNVTVSGNNNNSTRRLDIVHAGGTLDVTGPCDISAQVSSVVASSKVILRGSGVTAKFSLDKPGTNPWMALAACTESTIIAGYLAPSGAGAQAYTIDASSARCVLILGGTTHANFSVASTNAGTNCLVLTETFTGPAGAAGAGDDVLLWMGVYN